MKTILKQQLDRALKLWSELLKYDLRESRGSKQHGFVAGGELEMEEVNRRLRFDSEPELIAQLHAFPQFGLQVPHDSGINSDQPSKAN
jgi:hypothetical protein